MPEDAPVSLRLAQSAYNSPYSRSGAPARHPNTDPYSHLRGSALADLEAAGYDPKTMVEHGVVWAEDQDPYGHVMHSQYMHWAGSCLFRIMEGYDEWLSKKECDDMIQGKSVIIVVKKYELDLRRQVRYPDSIIAAYRQGFIEPTRNNGTVSLYSLKQQAVVADVKGSTSYVDVKTGRPVDIRTLGGGWPSLYDAYVRKSEDAKVSKETWEEERRGKKAGAEPKI
ncbi:hypothetical protein GGR56DRAFT_666001 [Xylariaceae sp. FL0804]|nr:hypothetical protein GGR56DRAFT_666001 [Xylariaceae sp. FL0804]